MKWLFKKTFEDYWLPLKLLSFTGFCFGNTCFGVVQKRKMTKAEMKEFCDYFEEGPRP